MINSGLKEFNGKRILMLQGPVGPFFSRFALDLSLAGSVVFKINFNGGDWFFSHPGSFARIFNFTDHPTQFSSYLDDLISRLNIDTVFLFGDCRPIHALALSTLSNRNIEIGVFEEGYFRPDYITLERNGVNDNSLIPRNPSFYLSRATPHPADASSLGSTYGQAAKWGMIYFFAATLGYIFFNKYQHHRRLGISDGPFWLLSYWRKLFYKLTERNVSSKLVNELSGQFYLIFLQTKGDSQMSAHSNFESVEEFIEHVIESFAKYAPKERPLVIKHHPLDRGYTDYTELIKILTVRHGLGNRCFYIHDQHLPTLLKHTIGVVVVNSTAGLCAIGEGVPVKVCGEAIYDLQGLTFQGSLDQFWKHCHLAVPITKLYEAFRNYLIVHTQHHGNFYKRLPGVTYLSGVRWATHNLSPSHIESQVYTPAFGQIDPAFLQRKVP